jgi:hypothetical protein
MPAYATPDITHVHRSALFAEKLATDHQNAPHLTECLTTHVYADITMCVNMCADLHYQVEPSSRPQDAARLCKF